MTDETCSHCANRNACIVRDACQIAEESDALPRWLVVLMALAAIGVLVTAAYQLLA